jgi:agmatine deiminase
MAVMPAEWEPHAGCWMGFPERRDNWRSLATPAQECFAAVASAISRFEPVTVCSPPALWSTARQMLPACVRVVEMSMDDAWFRDQAPVFVRDPTGHVAGVCWRFNAWGELCYSDWAADALISRKICELERVPVVDASGMVLEGGSIHVDGEGTLLTTEECLLEPNDIGKLRNPGMDKPAIEAQLRARLGVSKVIWLPVGAAHDLDTNGHVDNMCCFLRPGVVALLWAEEDENPEQHARSAAVLATLQSPGATDAKGRRLEVVKVLAPRPIRRTEADCHLLEPEPAVGDAGKDSEEQEPPRIVGEVLPASYINFYLPNGGCIVPQFGDSERDAVAVAVLTDQFPDREVVPVMSREILLGGGNIHCITMQQPVAGIVGESASAPSL